MHRVLERQLKRLGIADGPPATEQWHRFLERVDAAYGEADRDRYTLERALDLSSAEMRRRFTELRDAQRLLVEASRKAGMVDVATSVLHNIGNVLNSVNVSANVVLELLRSSPRAGLSKSLELLRGQPQPGRFLDEDPRGRKLLPYLAAVDKALSDERASMGAEIESLAKHLEHVKSIVGQQLAAARGEARGGRMNEQVVLDELVDDAVGVLRATLQAPGAVTFVRELEPVAVGTDRHKVFQILMNLLANARDAIDARPGAGTITLRTLRVGEGKVALEVEDDGAGIGGETLDRIFAHGFTTKPSGHGFGLHSSACAAIELGGSLSVRSAGVGRGAAFTLVIPSGGLPSRSPARAASVAPGIAP